MPKSNKQKVRQDKKYKTSKKNDRVSNGRKGNDHAKSSNKVYRIQSEGQRSDKHIETSDGPRYIPNPNNEHDEYDEQSDGPRYVPANNTNYGVDDNDQQYNNEHDEQYEHAMCHVRFLNNVAGSEDYDIHIGETNILNLSYKDLTAYINIPTTEKVITVSHLKVNVVSIDVTLNNNTYYTMIISGLVNDKKSIDILGYVDNMDQEVARSSSSIRFINASNLGTPQNFDVYENGNKIFSDVAFDNFGNPEYKPSELGYKTFTLKKVNDDAVVAGPVNVFLVSGGIYTLVSSGLSTNNQFPLTILSSHDNKNKSDELVDDFDANQYMGKWYQIASIPQFFNTDCARSTAEYTLLSDKIKVVNSCYDNNWNIKRTITGSAIPIDSGTPAALLVNFPGYQTPKIANYLVHDTNYITFAIVGSPDRSNLYILSREPKMTVCMYRALRRTARELGYDTSKLVINYHALSPNCDGKNNNNNNNAANNMLNNKSVYASINNALGSKIAQ